MTEVPWPTPTPTWASIKEQFAEPTFDSAARSEVGRWLTDTLERTLGAQWPEHAHGARALEGLTHLRNSNPEFFDYLVLALRLDAVRDVSGRRPLLDSLRTDFTAGRRRHVDTQLELASLGLSSDWGVVLEERPARDSSPLDVVLRRDGVALPIEVKTVLTSDFNRALHREVSNFDPLYMELMSRFEVLLGGTFPSIPSESGRSHLRSALEPVAALVQSDHVARQLDWGGTHLTLTWMGDAANAVGLTMPMPLQDDGARLPQKIAPKTLQATKSGARWLRLDMLGGYFQMSPWWNHPFPLQVDAIVGDLLDAGGESGFDGIVVSSGPVLTGRISAATVERSCGAVGLLRQVTPFDARTTVAIPLNGVGTEEVGELVALYDAEPTWLDAMLASRGLPSVAKITSQDSA